MLTPFIYTFRITFIIILAATTVICMNNKQQYSYSSATNNNTAQGRLWNHSTTSGNPLGIHLFEVDGNHPQIGTPHRMS